VPREKPGVETVYARLDLELVERLKAQAEAEERSITKVVKRALERYLSSEDAKNAAA
jgi:predicted transcriptional regulator